LINALVTFKKYINNVLREHLDKFVIVYLNNIIIYLINKEEYGEYVKWMLVVIKKCEFFTRKIDFVGFIIKLGQLNIDLKKIKAIVNW
ncbi:uncharacterized protein K441DRAFT_581302, partial [Cenococcum geophilum 1.58]|uniref:uncharacterized protein n=1 Tax=Cenococcum geophilum 1.58 TaxID=794803 RepID=UPI00358FBF30